VVFSISLHARNGYFVEGGVKSNPPSVPPYEGREAIYYYQPLTKVFRLVSKASVLPLWGTTAMEEYNGRPLPLRQVAATTGGEDSYPVFRLDIELAFAAQVFDRPIFFYQQVFSLFSR